MYRYITCIIYVNNLKKCEKNDIITVLINYWNKKWEYDTKIKSKNRRSSMAKLEDKQTKERDSKRNSSATLLAVYILQILKRHSSPDKKISANQVYEYLRDEYSLMLNESPDAQIKKVRRYLHTLHESYGNGCIRKQEGSCRRDGFEWFYDASRDELVEEAVPVQETLSEVELNILIDLISATKILNSEGTRGIIDKLLKKTSISCEDRKRRLEEIDDEAWFKSSNENLAEKKDDIQECIDKCDIVFDYENEEEITATPLGWRYDDGICFLNAIVEDKYRQFALDKIRNFYPESAGYEDPEDYRRYDEETDSDKTTLDSLFVNIPTIKQAIADKKCINFSYRSYRVSNRRVVSMDEDKSVLPHSLVFNDGKYYLIGIAENDLERNRVAFFRVDLMYDLYFSEIKDNQFDWDKRVFEPIERARIVEKHPLMLADKDIHITFKVVESALTHVADSFGIGPERMRKMSVTDETREVKDTSEKGFHNEKLVKVDVRTSAKEAFRWALANADVVEITTQDIRDDIARLATPIYQLYTQSMSDKVRENMDHILETGVFGISRKVDRELAFNTFKELKKQRKTDAIKKISIMNVPGEPGDYLGELLNTYYLMIYNSPECKNPIWASKLKNMQYLDIFNSQIEDLSWAKEMTMLTSVHITESPISDLSVLSDHKNIHLLHLEDLNVWDISFIEKYQHLFSLNLVRCPIKDFSPLFRIPSHLKTLVIDEKSAKKIDIEKLKQYHIGLDVKIQ